MNEIIKLQIEAPDGKTHYFEVKDLRVCSIMIDFASEIGCKVTIIQPNGFALDGNIVHEDMKKFDDTLFKKVEF